MVRPGMLMLLIPLALGLIPGDVPPPAVVGAIALVGLPLFVLGIAGAYGPRAGGAAATPIRPPVRGRWSALNSPATKVPSHGTHGYAQTYAIDLIADPSDGSRPAFGTGRGMRPAEDFPAFGMNVLAPGDGTVVRLRQRSRDHRSRTTLAVYPYLLVEGMIREVIGPGRILGNHIVIDHGGGVHSLIAHLQRGSAVVAEGDRVRAGDVIARCGNSGNSSEPHVHLQLMDRSRPTVAAGLPFSFTDIEVEGRPDADLPADGQTMRA